MPTRQQLVRIGYSSPACMACLPKQQQAVLALLPLLLKGAPSYSAVVGSGREHAGQPAVLHSTSAWWACCEQGADVLEGNASIKPLWPSSSWPSVQTYGAQEEANLCNGHLLGSSSLVNTIGIHIPWSSTLAGHGLPDALCACGHFCIRGRCGAGGRTVQQNL